MAEELGQLSAQFREPAIALGQLAARIGVVAGLDQIGDRFAHALNRQSDGVLDEVSPANAQLTPLAGGPFAAFSLLFVTQLFARLLDLMKELIALLDGFGDQLHG